MMVVNCFQKLLSSWWRTTWMVPDLPSMPLWIAFKNYYLRDEGQQRLPHFWDSLCCELLSKIIIFVMKDNRCSLPTWAMLVVNCFQKLLSSWWRTTQSIYDEIAKALWIAFKNYYLRDEGQLQNYKLSAKDGLWIAFKNYYLRDEGQQP